MSRRFVWNIERGRAPLLAGIVVLSFALAFLLGLLFPGPFKEWNDHMVDQLFKLRYAFAGKGEVAPNLVHVVVNDTTYRTMGLPGWDREVFGQALDILQDSGTGLIACDVLIKDRGYPYGDDLLVAAAKKAGRIILPLLLFPEGYFAHSEQDFQDGLERYQQYPQIRNRGDPPTAQYIVPPFRELREAAKGFGHINVSPDRDGLVRRIHLLYRYRDGYIPAFALKAVQAYFDVGQQDLEVFFGKYIVIRRARLSDDFRKDIFIPIDKQGRIIVNFVGPSRDSFLSFPVHRLLGSRNDSEIRSQLMDLVEGALVVLSDTSTTNRDFGPGVFDSVYPLSSLHMSVINSILTQSFLSDQSLLDSVLIALLVAVLLGLAAICLRAPRFFLSCLLLYAVYFIFNLCIFIYMHKVPLVTSPTLGFVFVLLSVNAYRLFQSEKEKSLYQARLQASTKLEAMNRELLAQKRNLEVANEQMIRELKAPQGEMLEPREADGADSTGSSRRIRSLELNSPEAFSEIVTNDELMLSKFKYIEAIAGSDHPVLITGESGVGKELVARVIHKLSQCGGKFISENIAGLDDTMVADTLFGHTRGAFTNAEAARKGLVEEARGGTLFLDEIGDMSVSSQVKLLRLIEEKEYRALGSDEAKISEARIIIATNANLEKKLKEGKFREDLFYRLIYRINIPPLRDRMEDLPLLIDHFVEQTAKALGMKKPAVPRELAWLLRQYGFPGNIRELKNMIDNALSRNKSRFFHLDYFQEYIRKNTNSSIKPDGNLAAFDKFPSLKEIELFYVREALRRAKGNQSIAARMLGLSPSALSRRISKRFGKEAQ
jgi:transcriptional regulator with PAS, ATPase and Fis domain/CHASE2 domain-containing sensor protein